jgi:4'-phosphopantetheinyl transferase
VTPPVIHVYKLRWPDRLAELAGLLSADEQERAARFHFDKDRQRFTVCRAWLRGILGGLLQTPPQTIVFSLGERGKPGVEGPWRFNLSHSHDWAVCAAAWDLPVGIDIEAPREIRDAEHLARQFFTSDEQRMVCSGPQNRLEHRFLTVWTRKEAFVKATGNGLYTDLGDFTAGLDASFIEDGSGQQWGVRNLGLVPDHAVALCAPGLLWDWREKQMIEI